MLLTADVGNTEIVLGVFAPKAEESRMADLGFDYMVTEALGSIDDDEGTSEEHSGPLQ